MLTAKVIAADTARVSTIAFRDRTDGFSRRNRAQHEKGGWIELEWQTLVALPDKIVTERRRIAVTRERAIQAQLALTDGLAVA